MQISEDFIENIKELYGKDGASKIIKAFNFASLKHAGQKRESGEEYISHSVAVAKILIDLKADEDTVVCGFLHDCLEDTDATEKEIKDNFGDEVLNILIGVMRICDVRRAYYKNGGEIEKLRNMFLAMGSDARVALVKLADRLHNMQTLNYKVREKQIKIAKETLDLYVPLAERLGMNIFKRQMEDLCFKYLYPKEYEEVNNYITEYYKKSESIVEDITKTIKGLAKRHGIVARIQSRTKSSYGVFKKWQTKGKDKVYDIIAHRIIVKNVQDCYTMLGAVNSRWKPVEGRIKDYIAQPKKNLYMSLHTTVLYPLDGHDIPFEIQIRTEEMHNFCEYGVAAHWIYKEKGSTAGNISNAMKLKNSLIKESEVAKIEGNAEQFLDNIKKGFYEDKIFVFTPSLNVVELPKGSIPIDFAYTIHTNIGNKCVGAKVNGKMVQLTTKLKTGDTVEIITSSTDKGPSRDWLKIVKSRSAASAIRSYFKKEKREENIKIGKDILEEYAKRNGFSLAKLFEDRETLDEVLEQYKLSSVDDIFAVVGYGGLTSYQILNKFFIKSRQDLKKERKKLENKSAKSKNEGVSIGGHSDLLKKFAKCCNPIPGDEIVGYVSRGKGVTIHRKNCPYLAYLEPERLMEVEWNSPSENDEYEASFKVFAKNTAGVLNTISNKIAENKIDISYIAFDKKSKSEDALLNIGVRIKSRKQLVEIINKLRAMNEVYDVYR